MIVFLRGDTFRFVLDLFDRSTNSVFDPVGCEVTAKLRDAHSRALIAELSATVLPAVGIDLHVAASETANWPLTDALLDVRLRLPNGDTVTTSPGQIRIQRAVSE